MGIALIRKLNEKTPYWVKRPFARVIRNKLIKNNTFVDTYEHLCQFDSMSKESKDAIQLESLKKMLQHAYEHTVYYHNLFDSIGFNPFEIKELNDLQRIPVLRKEDLKSHFEELMADDISDSYLVTTGGTSGEPTKVQMEKKAIYREWAFVYHYWSKFGYDFNNSRLATFRGVDLGEKVYEINPLYSEIRMNPFILNDNNISEYLRYIDNYGADFIYGYPSAVYNFCRIAKKANINLIGRFKAAFLISENLYAFQEKIILETLGCKIAMFYGHSERAVFGEKYDDGYIFNQMYGITEINADAEPVVTGFINGKTPLVRYLVDDKVESVSTETYEILGHRNADVLYGKNGEQISMAAINFHDDTFDGISAYQFVQYKAGVCVLRIVSDYELDEKILKKIEKRVSLKLGNGFSCRVEKTNRIEMTSRGKYKMLIQNIPGGCICR